MPRPDSSSGLVIGPKVGDEIVQEMEATIVAELQENIQSIRTKKGYEAMFEESEVLYECLKEFLVVLEERCDQDPDWAVRIDETGKAVAVPRTDSGESSFAGDAYKKQCAQKWTEFWRKHDLVFNKRMCVPVKVNHRLRGCPMHITST